MGKLFNAAFWSLLAIALGGAVLLFDHFIYPVPAPGAVAFLIIPAAAFYGGNAAGLLSAVIVLLYGVVYLSDPGQLLQMGSHNLQRFLMLATIAPLTAFGVGVVGTRLKGELAQERERHTATRATHHETLRLRAALDQICDGVVLLDRDFRLEFSNAAAERFSGLPRREPGERRPFIELIRAARTAVNPVGVEEFVARRMQTIRDGDAAPVDLEFAGGRIIRSKCAVLPNGGRLLSYTDVTDIVHHNQELEALHAALDQVEYGVVLLNNRLRARFINRAFRRMANLSDERCASKPTFAEMLQHGRETGAFVVEDDVDEYIAHRIKMVIEGNTRPVELRWSGGRVIRYQITPLPGGGRMLTYTDISDLARTAEQLQQLATTDSLTGLHNRRHFLSLAEHEWSRFRRYGRPMSILLADVDYFKLVNDRFGHDIGDRMIVHVANICQECKRSTDFVARLGGEEFAFLLPETELASARTVAERLRETMAQRPLRSGTATVQATVSVGVAEAADTMTGIADLMKLADEMLYEAKRRGRDRVVSARAAANEARDFPALVPFVSS